MTTSPRLHWTPKDARQACRYRSRERWGHYLTLGMSRSSAFAPDRVDDAAAAIARSATYYAREQLSAQEYLDQLEQEREAYAV